jgi:hypothetical protein
MHTHAHTASCILICMQVVNTSLTEGMCSALVEAMGVGTPVCARRNPGNECVVSSGNECVCERLVCRWWCSANELSALRRSMLHSHHTPSVCLPLPACLPPSPSPRRYLLHLSLGKQDSNRYALFDTPAEFIERVEALLPHSSSPHQHQNDANDDERRIIVGSDGDVNLGHGGNGGPTSSTTPVAAEPTLAPPIPTPPTTTTTAATTTTTAAATATATTTTTQPTSTTAPATAAAVRQAAAEVRRRLIAAGRRAMARLTAEEEQAWARLLEAIGTQDAAQPAQLVLPIRQ